MFQATNNGSSERIGKQVASKTQNLDPKARKELARKQHSQTGRDFMNRSALGMVGSSSDTGRIQIARSPDRAKAHTNLSVYSSDRNNQSALTNNFMQSKNPYQQQ